MNSATVVEKRDYRNYRFTMEISNRSSRSIFTTIHGKREKKEIERIDATFVSRQRRRDVSREDKRVCSLFPLFPVSVPPLKDLFFLRFSKYLMHLYIAAKYIA